MQCLQGKSNFSVASETSASNIENILQIFKIFKLVRIAKLIRHSTGLQAIAVTLIKFVSQHFIVSANENFCKYSSYKELTLLFLLICIAGLLFSSFVYFIEMDEVKL